MKHSQMHELMDDILKEVVVTRDSGQKEYAHNDDDVFANFNRVAHLLEEDRKKVLMTYMLKHIDGIAAYVKGHKSQREDVTGRITDCIVYLTLLWGMIKEEDGTISGKEDNASMHNVLEKIQHESGDLSLGGGRSTSYRVQPNGNLQEMRQKGSGLEKPKEVGTA
jgi:hypothetical protein